ncbi:MAG TPA: hypothetical protein VH372_07195 [Actinospica sp.]|nr:hypothetical protein [Actinospica sp.]
MHSGGTARALRAALFALVCVGAGTGLHQLADGCPPGLTGPVLALPVVWLAAYGLADKERSAGFVTLALGVAQLALHVELGWFCPKVSMMPGMPGYSPGHGTAAMVAAHAVAIAVCGWWLGRGERGFFELCRTAAFLADGVVDLLCGRPAADGSVVPAFPSLRGIHASAPRTMRPPRGPAPSPRVLRGPPATVFSR